MDLTIKWGWGDLCKISTQQTSNLDLCEAFSKFDGSGKVLVLDVTCEAWSN